MNYNLLISLRQRIALLVLIFFSLSILSRPAQAQTFTVLHEFTGGEDGGNPLGGVILDSSGNLYGTTLVGGAFGYGTLFKLDPTGKETVLQTFMGSNGLWPNSRLLRDSAGNLYGTTYDGGTSEGGACVHGCGTVFKIDPTGKETILHAFTGKADGSNPDGPPIRDAAGNLYGTTPLGGSFSGSCFGGCGVIFKLNNAGTETVLYTFTGPDGEGPDNLLRDAAGNLYGTTSSGGASGRGTIFKLDPAGKETVLYSFTANTDGGYPDNLIRDRAGNFYGTASLGGDLSCQSPYGCGVVFKLTSSGKFTVLYSFTGADAVFTPAGSLVKDATGNLYGTTVGASGAVFKLNPSRKLTVLHNFTGGGVDPIGGIIIDQQGNFYGTTASGGKGNCHYINAIGCGGIFKLTP